MVKKVGYCVYVHKSNIKGIYNVLNDMQKNHLLQVLMIGSVIKYDIVKYNRQNDSVSLIQCDTWDILNEPVVGDSYCYDRNFNVKIIKGGTKVYHNKWQFVADDYIGFDIEKARLRTEQWNKIPNISALKSKIGNKDFWYDLLRKNNVTI